VLFWEKHLLFSIGNGAEFRPPTDPKKIPAGTLVALIHLNALHLIHEICSAQSFCQHLQIFNSTYFFVVVSPET
jgi:hypothetical protein